MGQPSGDAEKDQLALVEAALEQQEWGLARELMQRLACMVPQNKQYRAQLAYARACELFAAGDGMRAREELERTLRLVPEHAAALALRARIRPTGRFLALFRR